MGEPERGTIAICFVEEALLEVRRRGLDARAMLQEAEISPGMLAAPQARVSSQTYGRLWQAIARTTDDEFFGMDSRRMKHGSFTLLCHSVLHADSLERALARALRFFRVVLDDIEGSLVREAGKARIVLVDHPPGAPPARAFAYGTLLLMLHGLACWLVGRRIPLESADFRCAEPPFSGEWRVLFTRQMNFGQASTGIVFPEEYLDLAPIQNVRTMKEFLRGAPANVLVRYQNSAGLTAWIRRRLRGSQPADWPSLGAAAELMHCSTATLRRRLEEEGQTYRGILDDMRRDLAISLLSQSQASLADVAAELGFAEPSAFHRAFKKWTGIAPGEYRRSGAPG